MRCSRIFAPAFRVRILSAISLFCLCCLPLFAGQAGAAEPAPLTLKNYEELNANLSSGGGVNWFNPGAYQIRDLGDHYQGHQVDLSLRYEF